MDNASIELDIFPPEILITPEGSHLLLHSKIGWTLIATCVFVCVYIHIYTHTCTEKVKQNKDPFPSPLMNCTNPLGRNDLDPDRVPFAKL